MFYYFTMFIFGTLIEGKASIYVGIYVDDIIYFSPDDTVLGWWAWPGSWLIVLLVP